MRRSVLVAPRGPLEVVSRDPLDVLQHGQRPRHRVLSEALADAAGSTVDERWNHNEVDPRLALLHLLHVRAAIPEAPAVWVRLPRRLSRRRRTRWRSATVVRQRDARGRFLPTASRPAPRAPVVPQAEVLLWLRGRPPEDPRPPTRWSGRSTAPAARGTTRQPAAQRVACSQRARMGVRVSRRGTRLSEETANTTRTLRVSCPATSHGRRARGARSGLRRHRVPHLHDPRRD